MGKTVAAVKDNDCPFCPILEGICQILKDEKCLDMVEKLRKGEIKPEAFIEGMRSKYPEKKIDEAIRLVRKGLSK